MTKAEKARQELLAAKMRQKQIAEKRRPLEESGYIQSQYGIVTRPQRLIDNGHWMKSSAAAVQSYKREVARKNKLTDTVKCVRIVK
jgi:hypothetical protein